MHNLKMAENLVVYKIVSFRIFFEAKNDFLEDLTNFLALTAFVCTSSKFNIFT